MPSSQQEIKSRLEYAVQFAREAGRLTLEYFRRRDLAVERKSDASPVTVADREAEQLLRQQISQQFPQDGILGEEFPERVGTSGFRWILDPIDGTKSFIHGVPLYGTLVGLEYESEPVGGVIFIPPLDECLWAAKGQGAWYQQANSAREPAKVSTCTRLAEALVVTSEIANFDAIGRFEVFQRLNREARLLRTWGDCYGYLMVATGRAEVAIDPIMNIWDAAALLPILQEAGGTFTDWQGRPTVCSGQGVATNGFVLNEVLAVLGCSDARQDSSD
ncbi:MAG: histidinol-phosphatase [Thermoguttaceae bacterium]|nr:histidinol-phosphatase [Thermoguttaceae bacterium]MDW8036451.1 histidinol-phosphatase [Thermoguttaceae bacterium]